MTSNKLQQAITFIKSGDKQNGYQILIDIIKVEPKNETAWLWMSSVVANDAQRRYCLKQVLAINPDNQLARKGLARLQQVSQKKAQPHSAPKNKPTDNLKRPDSLPVESQIEDVSTDRSTATQPIVPVNFEDDSKTTNLPEPASKETVNKSAWINPKSLLNKVTILYDDAIVAANPDGKELKQIQLEFSKGVLPSSTMLGSSPDLVYINTITSVSANKYRKDINIRYKKGKKPDTLNISFANSDARDEFFNALQKKLGPNFEYTLKKFNVFEAMVMPIIVMGIVVFGTYLCHGAAIEGAAGVEPEIRGRNQLLKLVSAWFIMLIGPTGVLILGVIFVALILFWLFDRVLRPPVMMNLFPAKNPLQKKSLSKVKEPEELPSYLHPVSASSLSQPAQKTAKPKKTVKPAKPKKPFPTKAFIRVTLLFLILISSMYAGYLWINRPVSYPGLIEGGMVLDLSNRGLTNEELKALSIQNVPQANLILVDLSGNQLTEIPPEIGQLTGIEYLYIKRNPLTRLPPEIGQLTNLKLLYLANNQLTEIPPEIGQLTNLEVLGLQGNNLTHLPPEIGQLTNLKELIIQNNPIRQLPSEIEQLPGLAIH